MWPFNRKEKEEKEPKASDWADAGPLLIQRTEGRNTYSLYVRVGTPCQMVDGVDLHMLETLVKMFGAEFVISIFKAAGEEMSESDD